MNDLQNWKEKGKNRIEGMQKEKEAVEGLRNNGGGKRYN